MPKVTYDYDSRRDIEEASTPSINIIRVLGLFFIIFGLTEMSEHWQEGSSFKLGLYSLQISLGLFQLLYPKYSLSRLSFNRSSIKIDEEAISWKLGKMKAIRKIKIYELKNILSYPGEVHLRTEEKNYVLSKYLIESKLKFEEFNKAVELLANELN